jgi:pyruvate/2-oxoacid:ferredoxin oxidoreductase alpha subunit
MLQVPRVYEEVQEAFAQVFGRRLDDPVVPYRAEDAETLIVSMGTLGTTAERVVDARRERGEKVGSLRIRLFRPLPAAAIRTWFSGKRGIAVLDRDISLGFGGVLWGEVKALADPDTVVQGYISGLGGGDLRPHHIEKILTDLRQRQGGEAPLLMEAL